MYLCIVIPGKLYIPYENTSRILYFRGKDFGIAEGIYIYIQHILL